MGREVLQVFHEYENTEEVLIEGSSYSLLCVNNFNNI